MRSLPTKTLAIIVVAGVVFMGMFITQESEEHEQGIGELEDSDQRGAGTAVVVVKRVPSDLSKPSNGDSDPGHERWRELVHLCLFSSEQGFQAAATLRASSLINDSSVSFLFKQLRGDLEGGSLGLVDNHQVPSILWGLLHPAKSSIQEAQLYLFTPTSGAAHSRASKCTLEWLDAIEGDRFVDLLRTLLETREQDLATVLDELMEGHGGLGRAVALQALEMWMNTGIDDDPRPSLVFVALARHSGVERATQDLLLSCSQVQRKTGASQTIRAGMLAMTFGSLFRREIRQAKSMPTKAEALAAFLGASPPLGASQSFSVLALRELVPYAPDATKSAYEILISEKELEPTTLRNAIQSFGLVASPSDVLLVAGNLDLPSLGDLRMTSEFLTAETILDALRTAVSRTIGERSLAAPYFERALSDLPNNSLGNSSRIHLLNWLSSQEEWRELIGEVQNCAHGSTNPAVNQAAQLVFQKWRGG